MSEDSEIKPTCFACAKVLDDGTDLEVGHLPGTAEEFEGAIGWKPTEEQLEALSAQVFDILRKGAN